MTNKEETDPTESQIVRASVLESHGWSSEPNRSQCKLRVQEINSLVFFCYLIFFFSIELPLFLFYVTRAWIRRGTRWSSVWRGRGRAAISSWKSDGTSRRRRSSGHCWRAREGGGP